jgi:hypothetical protein
MHPFYRPLPLRPPRTGRFGPADLTTGLPGRILDGQPSRTHGRIDTGKHDTTRGHAMAKGLDKKKETKKKPEKSLKEKRAAKSEKKATRS